jgi:hypothetical protein
MDVISLSDGLALFKSGMEGMRGAVTLWKDFKGVLPADKQEQVDKAIERSEEQLKLAEAQIAKGLGFPLCTCAFPPPVMLKVGHVRRLVAGAPGHGMENVPVHECPRCRLNDTHGRAFTRDLEAPGALPNGAVA